MAITFNPSSLTMRVGFKQTVVVTSTTPITSIAAVDARIITVAGATGSTTASVVIMPVNGSYGVGKLRIGNSGGELVDLNITVLGIDTSFVSSLIGIASSDIGTLCQGLVGTVQKINRWSYRKPVRRALAGGLTLTDAHILAAKCGLSPAAFTTYGNSSGIQFTGLAPWAYLHPLAPGNPFSLDDFAGYNPQAKAPLKPTLEITWNVADGGTMPLIPIPYKYNSSKSYQGSETAGYMALMECMLENIIASNPTEYYLCAIMHCGNTPFVRVANAVENLARTHSGSTDAQAGTIDIRPFSMSYWLTNFFDPIARINGMKYELRLALNRIPGRDLGKVMSLATLDARSTGDFNTNNSATDYNGYHNNEFLNMPDGETILNWYTYYLLSWMYAVDGPVILRVGTNSTGGYVPVTLQPNVVNELNDTTVDGYYNNRLGFNELIFTAVIVNNGASITIDGRTFYRGSEGDVTINMIPASDRSTTVAVVVGGSRQGHFGIPKGYCWKSGNGLSKVYTIVQTPLMTHSIIRRVYNDAGTYLGDITSKPAVDQLVYNGITYYRSTVDDIRHLNVTQPLDINNDEKHRTFGIRQIGGSPGFSTSLTIPVGASMEVEFHLHDGAADGNMFDGEFAEDYTYFLQIIYNSQPAEEIPASVDQFQDTYTYRRV